MHAPDFFAFTLLAAMERLLCQQAGLFHKLREDFVLLRRQQGQDPRGSHYFPLLVVTSATLLVTSALLVVTRS